MDLNALKNLASSENIANLKEKAGDLAHTVAEKAEEIGKNVNMDTVKSFAGKVGEGARKIEDALENLPGAAANRADDNKVNPSLVKQDTKILNNNPRNSDM